MINVDDFGAKACPNANDLPAFQNALSQAKANGGGTVYMSPYKKYYIEGTLNIPSTVKLFGNNSWLIQNEDEMTIISFGGDRYSLNMGLSNITLDYASGSAYDKTNWPAAISLIGPNQSSYNDYSTFLSFIRNVEIKNAGTGIQAINDSSNSNSQYTCWGWDIFDILVSDWYGWVLDIQPYGITSGATNINIGNVYGLSTNGTHICKGFNFKNIGDLIIRNIQADHLRSPDFLFIETCRGSIENVTFEGAIINATTEYHGMVKFSNCRMMVNKIAFYNCEYIATNFTEFAAIRMDVGSIVTINFIIEESITTPINSNYYIVQPSGSPSDFTIINVLNYKAGDSTPDVNIPTYDCWPLQLQQFNNNILAKKEGGINISYRNNTPPSNPSQAGFYQIGDKYMNTNPGSNDPLGWVCISLDTNNLATWRAF